MRKNQFVDFIKPTILLAGAFTFAFLLGEMVHEYGHYLSHMAYGNSGVGVYLNPFGSSKIIGVTSLPIKQMGVTSAAGPLTNLVLGVVLLLSLWRIRRPILFPLLLWGPVAMIQEGVNFSLGLLTPGGDAAWISTLGIPKSILIIVGISLIAISLVVITLLLSSLGITGDGSRFRTFLIILLGMCSLMLIRFVYTALTAPESITENLVPLVFSVLLAVIAVLIQPIIVKTIQKNQISPAVPLTRGTILTALALGASIFLFQVFYSIIVT